MFEKPSSVFSEEQNTTEWITEDEFYEIYPELYRDCHFFSEPVTYCLMSKEEIKRRNNIKPFPLNLSKWLQLQRKLPKTVHVGHSVDTKILTAVLNYNPKFASTSQTLVLNSQESLSQNSLIGYSKEFTNNKGNNNLNEDRGQNVKNIYDLNLVNELDTNSNFKLDKGFESLCELDLQALETETGENKINKETNFDIGNTSDIFRSSAECSPDRAEDTIDNSEMMDILDYFHLSSIDDIFSDSDDKVPEPESENEAQSLNTTNIVDSIVIESDEDVFDAQ